jgi:protein ImuA
MVPIKKADIFSELQADILRLQGFKSGNRVSSAVGLGPLQSAFPNGTFPTGAVHEFVSEGREDASATHGFVSGLLSELIDIQGAVLWISSSRTLFPPALKSFGLRPDHFIFLDVQKETEVTWAMDEALKCGALAAVVGETREVDFNTSRRLQLAVEQSQVTGFILRNNYRTLNPTACVSRWKISSLPSELSDDLPGVGFPKWKVELLRMRNGKSGTWSMQWINGRFACTESKSLVLSQQQERKKAG